MGTSVEETAETADDRPDAPGASSRAPDDDRPILYVGLGASAGGLEALREFLDGMSSNSGIAFIVVQHLSPDHKSLMDELLAKNTEMSVESVVDGVEVRANAVYLIPPRKNMVLADGRLHLKDVSSDQGVNLPIDFFFRSLAESMGGRSVGIVLSGTGSDGSRGIRAIKEAGGLVLVQEPDTAKFDGMPWSAVNTGLADVVLDPVRLADYLESYARQPLVLDGEGEITRRLEDDDGTLHDIFALLRKQSGIEFSYYKPSTVARRIERRMGVHQLAELGDYLDLLRGSEREVETLARELLINVTRFFRDTEAFDYLEAHVVGRLFDEERGESEVRVWIAGCSSGEEAYSIAMLLDEARRRHASQRRLKVFATDVDPDALAEASLARYALDIEQDVTEERLARYFSRDGDRYALRPEVRQLVVFANHNMISDPPFSHIDLICCRNVLIYFRHAVQQKIIASFHFSLRRDGVIFFGSSESIGELKSHFEPLDERLRIFRKSSSARLPSGTLRGPLSSSGAQVGSVTLPPVANLLRSSRQTVRDSPFEHVKDSLINDFVPACLILDAEHHAVHIYGDASRFLTRFPMGRVSTSVHDIIAEELSVPASTALARAQGEREAVYYASIPTTIDGEEIEIDLQSEYFPEKNGKPAHFVLILSETTAPAREVHGHRRFDIGEETRRRIKDLEAELLNKQQHLQVTNEELETTNEELQSTNEELMSSNEELQSANEELQSVNEELFTVNNEYQEKISELSIANNDLDNVLSFTSVGIIFLDRARCIRKYTEVASRFFRLMPTDVGRPLHHISNALEYPRMFEDIDAVVAEGAPIDRDVFTDTGDIIQIRMIPYRATGTESGGSDDHLQGTILTLTDLTVRVRQDRERRDRLRLENGDAVPASDDTPRYRVLVIDDSESDRVVLKRQLSKVENIAVEVIEATDIASGMEALERDEIDVCLVDYRLGPDTANDFAASARRADHWVPVIMVSGYTREELHEELPSSSLTHFINKEEISPLLLELTLRNAVETAHEHAVDGTDG